MKFIRLLLHDVKHGIILNYKLYIIPLIFQIISLLIMNIHINNYKAFHTLGSFNLGDVICYTFGGIGKVIVTPDSTTFHIPVIWLAVFSLFLFAILIYPVSSLDGFGSLYLIKGNKRISWWFSKCIWLIFSTIIYLGIVFLSCIAFCIFNKVPLNLSVNGELIHSILDLDRHTKLYSTSIMPANIIFIIFLVTITVGLIQMVLSLWIKPIFCFLAINVFLLTSTYFQNYVAIGNYAILIRHDWINEDGINYNLGFPILLILIVILIFIGAIKFKKLDILAREDN